MRGGHEWSLGCASDVMWCGGSMGTARLAIPTLWVAERRDHSCGPAVDSGAPPAPSGLRPRPVVGPDWLQAFANLRAPRGRW
jgi:hypothetical protein